MTQKYGLIGHRETAAATREAVAATREATATEKEANRNLIYQMHSEKLEESKRSRDLTEKDFLLRQKQLDLQFKERNEEKNQLNWRNAVATFGKDEMGNPNEELGVFKAVGSGLIPPDTAVASVERIMSPYRAAREKLLKERRKKNPDYNFTPEQERQSREDYMRRRGWIE